ncbi:MAG: Ig-like domain-containing protein, partial [Aurantibacter sp.]
FGEPMDFATCRSAISVWTPKGETVAGITEIVENEKVWKFLPEKPWISGTYRVRIYSKLEDLAGNNLNRVFDRDLASEPMTPSEQEFYWLHFEVSNGK